MLYLDLSILSVQRVGGISTVWREYVKRLGAHFGASDVTLLTPVDVWGEVGWLNRAGFRMRPVAPRGRISKYAPLAVVGRPGDVLHTSYYQSAPLFRGRRVVTVHDLTYHKMGRGFRRAMHQAAMQRAVYEADVVVCPSRATAADVRGRLRFRGRIEVVPHGVDREVFYPEPVGELERRPFLLWVGRRDWYRDFGVAVEAVRRLRLDDPAWQLRVAGEAEDESWPDWVVFEGCVGEERLRRLYSSARGLAYLSRSEGFGLPILEAQACGCAVICYREPACRETAGAGAVFVDVGDAREVAEAVRGDRGGLVERGFENVGRYSWEGAVARLAGIYGVG